jgi:photosystem II stability/assembly factor-like uncharacterized protein
MVKYVYSIKLVVLLIFFLSFSSCEKQEDENNAWVKVCDTNIGSNNSLIKTSKSNVYFFFGSEFHRSQDNGKTWVTLEHDLPSYVYNKIEVIDSNVFLASPKGLYYSANSGDNWDHLSIGDSNFDTANIKDVISDGWNVYVVTYNNFYWLDVSAQQFEEIILPVNTYNLHFNRLAISGSDVYVSTNDGIYKSSDSGVNWENVNDKVTLTHDFISSNDYFIYEKYSAFYISSDYGVSWTSLSTKGMKSSSIQQIACQGTNFFARTGDGIYISSDNCTTWTYIDGTGIKTSLSSEKDYNVYNFAVNENTIYAQIGDLWARKY